MALFVTKNVHKRKKWFDDHGILDYAITTEDGKIMESFKRVLFEGEKDAVLMPYKEVLDYSRSPREIFLPVLNDFRTRLKTARNIIHETGEDNIPEEVLRTLVEILENPPLKNDNLKKIGYKRNSEGKVVPIDKGLGEKPSPVAVPQKSTPKDYFTKPSSDGRLSAAFLTKHINTIDKDSNFPNR